MDVEQEEHQPILPLVDPVPINALVLTLHDRHRSSLIWNGVDVPNVKCHQADASRRHNGDMPPLDPRVVTYLVQSGFYGVYKIGFIEYDMALITASSERWSEETRTFQFQNGEATITLQDVGVLVGLPVDGHVVTSFDGARSPQGWTNLCLELLGVRPPNDRLKRCAQDEVTCGTIYGYAGDEMIHFHARAYILALIGGVVLSDCSKNRVKLIYLPLLRNIDIIGSYSWGSASLACLYKELSRATRPAMSTIGGFLNAVTCISSMQHQIH